MTNVPDPAEEWYRHKRRPVPFTPVIGLPLSSIPDFPIVKVTVPVFHEHTLCLLGHLVDIEMGPHRSMLLGRPAAAGTPGAHSIVEGAPVEVRWAHRLCWQADMPFYSKWITAVAVVRRADQLARVSQYEPL